MTDKQDPIAHAARLLREAAEELRQAHAYNNSEGWENETDAKAAYDEHLAAAQALEDWEEAVGAGGVRGPLVGQPQAMPDLTALTERGAKAWTAVDAQALREGRWYMVTHDGVATLCEDRRDAEKEAKDADMAWPHSGPHRAVQLVEASTAGFTAADMATASAQGFRDGVAAPPAAQAEGWTRLPGALPEPGMPVLLDIGKKRPIRAMWAAKHTVQAADDDTDWGEYVEEDDMYYAPEGWYEWNQCEENHWRVTETPRAWMPLPPTSAEGGAWVTAPLILHGAARAKPLAKAAYAPSTPP